MIYLFNTLGRKKEEFVPIKQGEVGIYTCGPTLYWEAHIGNLRAYIMADILKRVLVYNQFKVKHVENYTDVGHLTSDSDTGEDKVEKTARELGMDAWEMTSHFQKIFETDEQKLNIIMPDILSRATEHIPEQIELIKKLEEKGFTYQTTDGIYFDTSKLSDYGKLVRLDIGVLKEAARVEKNEEKKNPTDFALWKFSPKDTKRQMEWESPWGIGFPGWHIECSAMSMKYMGDHFDIHTGGIDHIPVHHTNEIAQNEAVTGHQVVNFWLHFDFLTMEGEQKMAKSAGNFVTVRDLEAKGFNPIAYRYLNLIAHFSTKIEFSWVGLAAAQNALFKIYGFLQKINQLPADCPKSEPIETLVENSRVEFRQYINDNLDLPKAISLLHKIIDKTEKAFSHEIINTQNVLQLLLDFDRVLGLGLSKILEITITDEQKEKIKLRENLRAQKKFDDADLIRKELADQGLELEDTLFGTVYKNIRY